MLWFDIKEGPRAQITDVKWAGVGEPRLPEVEEGGRASTTPAPYVAADVNDARMRIEDRYRRQGFNSAEVEVQPAVAPDDTVALTFDGHRRHRSRCCRTSSSPATRSRTARC